MALQMLIDVVAKLGLRIEPYLLFIEQLGTGCVPALPTGLDGHEVTLLEAGDMRSIATIPGRNFSEADLLRRLQQGMGCMGIKYRGAVVAFTWFNLSNATIEKHRLFGLRQGEAHLFDAYTVESFRGKNLAPYMRYRCYEELAALGRNRCYSVSTALNTPALRFKKKLGARVSAFGMFVEILRHWRFDVRLKTYPVPVADRGD
ncbi:MAG: hypothetical protein L0H83_03535 [Salinisphaera sp.]|nr:hypothetical protein [Salinisphaera sp.]